MHPFVIGELAAGNLANWRQTIAALRSLRQAPVVDDHNFFNVVFEHRLMGTGLGFVDIHLLVATLTTHDGKLWSRDKRLAMHAERLGRAYNPD
jgi:hypothetical protein